MMRTVEAVIDEDGTVRLLEEVHLSAARRALVTILDDAPAATLPETALLSEASLAEDWNRPEEDAAWSHMSKQGLVSAYEDDEVEYTTNSIKELNPDYERR